MRAFGRTPGRQKSEKIEFTVSITVAVRLDPVAMLEDASAVEPSSLCPDPSRATWEEMEDTARTPLSSPSSSLQASDHRDLARADPQHPVAETKPLQHASKAVEPGVARARRQHTLRRPLIGRPRPDSLAYKSPRRSNEWTHTTPSSPPDIFSSPRSL
jgi:hypothetical protein